MFSILITSHGLSADEQHATLLDIWMLSSPRPTNKMWYNTLSKSSSNDSLPENYLNLAKTEHSDVECLVMKKYSKLNPKYSLAVDACNIKHTAICRVGPPMISFVEETPKFPCLTKNPVDRRKRSYNATNNQEIGTNIGIFPSYS